MISKIVFTGPESSGKSTLAKAISKKLELPMLEEYARVYLQIHGLKYTEDDVDKIGEGQEKMEKDLASKYPLVVLDTDWTVIEIWKNVVYGTSSDMDKSVDDKLYFLCYPDIPWEYDEMRENPNDREELFIKYKKLLDESGAEYVIIKGGLKNRIDDTINKVNGSVI